MANKKAMSLLRGIAVTGTTMGGVSVFTDVTLAMSAELEDVQAQQMSGELYIQIEEETLAEECNIEADTDVVNTENQNLETEDEIDSVEDVIDVETDLVVDVIDVETDLVENNTDSDEDNVISNQSPVMMRTLGNVRLMAASITPDKAETDTKSDAIQFYGDEIRNASEEEDVTESVINLLTANFDIDKDDDTTGNVITTEIDGKTVYVVTDSNGDVSYYIFSGVDENGVINFDKVEVETTSNKVVDEVNSSRNLSKTNYEKRIAELTEAGLVEGEDYVVEENLKTFENSSSTSINLTAVTNIQKYIRDNYTTTAKWNALVKDQPYVKTKSLSSGTNTDLPTDLDKNTVYVGVYKFNGAEQPVLAYYRYATPVGGSKAMWGWYGEASGAKGTVMDRAATVYIVGAVGSDGTVTISTNTYNITVYNTERTNTISDVEGDISVVNSASNSTSTSESTSELESTVNSESASTAKSESESEAASESISVSESESASRSASLSEIASQSEVDSISDSASASASASTSISIVESEIASNTKSESISDSESESKVASESLSTAKSESESIANSESISTANSESEVASTNYSVSASESQSIADSVSSSTSQSIVESLSSSTSESIIVSLSSSTSESLVESLSNSISASESASESVSESLSNSTSESAAESLSDSMSDSSNNYTSDGGSDSTTSASEGDVAQSYTDIDAFTSAVIRDDEVPLVGDFLTDNIADIDINNTVAIASEQAPTAAQIARVPLGVINEFEDEEELYTSIDTETIADEETALGIEDISSGRVWWHWTLIIIGIITGTVAYDKRRREFVNIKNR